MLKNLLGIGLSGRLTFFKHKYKNGIPFFNHQRVLCDICELSGSRFVIRAQAYCTDACLTYTQNLLTIYKKTLSSEEEALGCLVKEIRYAIKNHPDAYFYRSLNNEPFVFLYNNGKWEKTIYEAREWESLWNNHVSNMNW